MPLPPEETVDNRDDRGRFAQGVKMGGRPKGARNRLGEEFLSALADDFSEHGAATIARVRSEDPVAYVKVCASILPKELNVRVDPLEELSDEELDRRIRGLADALRLEVGVGAGAGGEAPEDGAEPSGGVSSVH